MDARKQSERHNSKDLFEEALQENSLANID